MYTHFLWSTEKAGPPLNVQTTGHTQTSVSLAWTPPKKLPVGGHTISGYKILYKQEGQSDASGKKIDVPSDPAYTVTGKKYVLNL